MLWLSVISLYWSICHLKTQILMCEMVSNGNGLWSRQISFCWFVNSTHLLNLIPPPLSRDEWFQVVPWPWCILSCHIMLPASTYLIDALSSRPIHQVSTCPCVELTWKNIFHHQIQRLHLPLKCIYLFFAEDSLSTLTCSEKNALNAFSSLFFLVSVRKTSVTLSPYSDSAHQNRHL